MNALDPKILSWILHQPNAGEYSVAIMRMQAEPEPGFQKCDLRLMVLELERRVMQEALDAANGVVQQAAELVGLKRTTFAARAHQIGVRYSHYLAEFEDNQVRVRYRKNCGLHHRRDLNA